VFFSSGAVILLGFISFNLSTRRAGLLTNLLLSTILFTAFQFPTTDYWYQYKKRSEEVCDGKFLIFFLLFVKSLSFLLVLGLYVP
jgi:hypothetical protein